MLAEWPLTGRGRELAHLRRLLGNPRSRGAMLAGPAGVGKTRLARECLADATRADMALLNVTGNQALAAIPYGAVASMLSAFGGVGRNPSEYPDPGSFVNDVMLDIIARSGPRRVFLLVDDAHLLDSASALLILRLAQREEVFVLLTVRSREPVSDAITSLWKDGLLDRLEIANLDRSAVEELLTTVLRGPIDGATLTTLLARSEANLLFLRELVAAALADGTLRQEHGLWRLVGESSPSDRLIEVVESRLARLSPDELDLLELTAIGEPLGAHELGTLSRLEVAERLEDLGLVTSSDDGRRLELRLAHPVYGEVLRSRLGGPREQQLARSLAEAVEGTGMRRRGDILRVGTWRLRSGGGAPDQLLTAATTARWQYDLDLAYRLAQAATAAGAGLDAELLSAQLQVLRGQPAAAEKHLADLMGRLSDPQDRVRTALARLDIAYLQAQPFQMREILDELGSADVDDSVRADLEARRLVSSLFLDGPRAVVAQPLPPYDETQDDAAFPIAVCRAQGYARMGQTTAAKRELEKLDAHVAAARVGLWRFPGIFLASELLADEGHLAESIHVMTQHYQHGLETSSTEVQAISAWALGHRYLLAGRLQTAARFAREAIAGCDQLGVRAGVVDATGLLALISSIAPERPSPGGGRGAPQLDDSTVFSLGLGGQVQAWTAIGRGDTERARTLLRTTADRCLRIGDLKWAVSCLHALVRIGHPTDALESLETVTPEMDGPWPGLYLRHAAALAGQDAAALRRTASEFDVLGATLLAAEAAAQASVAWELAGDSREASADRTLARSLAQRCEGASTPALQILSTHDTLTEAERDTARFAAKGLSNKDIAKRLQLSVRTVESRLQTVYNKLGIRSRDALADALSSLPDREGPA